MVDNRSMATESRTKLRMLFTKARPGAAMTLHDLAELGISSDLAVHYANAGWLERLAQGVYARPADRLEVQGCLVVLQEKIKGLHVGGKSALEWHGISQYVSQIPTLRLYGCDSAKLPEWFTTRFPAHYHRKRLFREAPEALLQVKPYKATLALVSAPERALLEMLSEVGVRQPLQEAREIMETTHTIRSAVLNDLLQRCTSVKTVRLCLQFARELDLPWASKLEIESLPIGSKSAWVARSAEGLLVLK